MKRISIGTLFVVIYGLLVFWFGWATFNWLQTWGISIHPLLFAVSWFVISFGYIIGRISHSLKLFTILGSYWFIILQYGLIIIPIATIIYIFSPTEKTLFIVGNVVTVIFLAIFIAGSFYAFSPVIRHKTIQLTKSAGELNELKLIMASDFHLGLLSNKKHLQRFVNLANKEQPDLILLAGDLVDDDPIWFVKDGMSAVMRQLKSTYGIYGVLGNHEYYGRKIPLLVQEMKAAGVKMLIDETICVEQAFYVTGREDVTNRNRKSLVDLSPMQKELPWFVMDHTPMNLKIPSELGVDVHVSGHTHLGQMWPNHLFTRRLFELDYGY
ncbi:MAG: metallophosphoesterase, partial [Paenisporosarcina sp.]